MNIFIRSPSRTVAGSSLALAVVLFIILHMLMRNSSVKKTFANIMTNKKQGGELNIKNGYDIKWQLKKSYNERNLSIYHFDRPGTLLPLLRVTKSEKDKSFRAKVVSKWLKTQRLIVAATVRNAKDRLSQTMKNIHKLSQLFSKTELVFVENNSHDGTRQYLLKAAREAGLKIQILGCPGQPMNENCTMKINYRTGKEHKPHWSFERTLKERIDRGIVMGALRNVNLHAIYSDYAPDHNTLLMILDPDTMWTDWDMEAISAGLYYFKTRPQLKQLCANARVLNQYLYDPCTLVFFPTTIFGEDTKYDHVDYEKSIFKGPKDLAPVKVISCFQGLSFYRVSHLAARQIRYRRSHGEWLCEHDTISRQLDEVYIDPQMRLIAKGY